MELVKIPPTVLTLHQLVPEPLPKMLHHTALLLVLLLFLLLPSSDAQLVTLAALAGCSRGRAFYKAVII